MAKPSLFACKAGLQQANEAFAQRSFTQESLAAELGCNRSVISKFLNGERVWEKYFTQICEALELDWQKIAYGDVAPLVQTLRAKVKDSIQEWCGTMRVLDMTMPVELSHIYTDVKLLEKRTALRRKTVSELQEESHYHDLERFGLGAVLEERVPGKQAVEQYRKLVILGKPGAGKTTFLKHLAIQCNQGEFKPELVPIFVPLKYFSEEVDQPGLIEYMQRQLSEAGVAQEELHELLKHGQALILLDGLDEVRTEYQAHALREIRNLSRLFFENHFMISCRIAAWDYTFDKFMEVEIADFDDQQIQEFAHHWFRDKSVKPQDFICRLKAHNRAYQLAVTPLLLTLICLVYEESGLPNNRSELYKEGLHVLLKKWDAQRGIYRDKAYQDLSPAHKENLLRHIASQTFETYYFTPLDIKSSIDDYIGSLSNPSANPEVEPSEIDVIEVLSSIEAQHGLLVERARGIYSFSHLTFQEYFVAQKIANSGIHLERELESLVAQHLSNPRWREVILLVAEILPDGEAFLWKIKAAIDQILVRQPHLQTYLKTVSRKALALRKRVNIKPAAIRCFYFDFDGQIAPLRRSVLLLDRQANYLVCGYCFARMLQPIADFETGVVAAKQADEQLAQRILNASSTDEILRIAVQYGLEQQSIREELKDKIEKIHRKYFADSAQLDQDRLHDGANQIRNLISRKPSETQLIQFSHADQERLEQYYNASSLLIECLNSDCFISGKARSSLSEALFLPLTEVGPEAELPEAQAGGWLNL